MIKIIPMVMAILAVVGGGAYMMTVRSGQKAVEESRVVVTNEGEIPAPSDIDQKQLSEQATPAADKTIDATKNQITLSLSSPKDGSSVTSSKITVRGRTTAKAEVSVNETDTIADVNGNFSATISIEEGDNYIIVVAVDEDGNVAEQEMNVIYEKEE